MHKLIETEDKSKSGGVLFFDLGSLFSVGEQRSYFPNS